MKDSGDGSGVQEAAVAAPVEVVDAQHSVTMEAVGVQVSMRELKGCHDCCKTEYEYLNEIYQLSA